MKTLEERINFATENYPELDSTVIGEVFTYLDNLRDSGFVIWISFLFGWFCYYLITPTKQSRPL